MSRVDVKKIMAVLALEKKKADAIVMKVTTNTTPSSPSSVVILSPLQETEEEKEMKLIFKLADQTFATVVENAKKISVYTTRSEIVAGLRGETGLYVNQNINMMYKGGWVALPDINLREFPYEEVFPPHITDVEFNGNKTAIRATYGYKGYVGQIRYIGEYVPYNGPFSVFCFTHFSQNGLGSINHNRPFNVLRTPERTSSKGVVAFVDLKKNPVELWSRVGDRYGNEVCCLDPKILQYVVKIVYDCDYMDKIETNHQKEISYLQTEWNVEKSSAIARVKKLIITVEDDEDDFDELCAGIKSM